MGISEADLAFVAAIADLRSMRRVCDLGDRHLFCNDDHAFDRLGLKAPRTGAARDFWTAIGAEYLSLDVVGFAQRFDLNVDRVPDSWARFDLVTNCGTTEHIIHQENCFRVIQDLTRPGGVMYHQPPVAGYAGHGFFVYSLKFFAALIEANAYKLLAARIDTSSENAPNVERPMGNLSSHLEKLLQVKDAGARIALRKTTADPFVLPMDVPKARTIIERAASKLKRMVGIQP